MKCRKGTVAVAWVDSETDALRARALDTPQHAMTKRVHNLVPVVADYGFHHRYNENISLLANLIFKIIYSNYA